MLDPSQVRILNESLEGGSRDETLGQDGVSAVELSKNLHRQLLKIKGKFLSDDGSKVDYIGFREHPDFRDFEEESRKLNSVDLTALSEKEQKAFFINVYNTLTIHALAVLVKEESSVLQLDSFWQKNGYMIGKCKFSLDDIEHGVLRCNKFHPTYKDYFFKEGDPRRQFVQKKLDPRIHFALNCGAKSCPPIRLFSDENMDSAMDMAAKSFCQNDIIINTADKTVTASKIFMWYGGDFGPDEKTILRKILQYLNEDQATDLNSLLKDNFALTFTDYDWKLV